MFKKKIEENGGPCGNMIHDTMNYELKTYKVKK